MPLTISPAITLSAGTLGTPSDDLSSVSGAGDFAALLADAGRSGAGSAGAAVLAEAATVPVNGLPASNLGPTTMPARELPATTGPGKHAADRAAAKPDDASAASNLSAEVAAALAALLGDPRMTTSAATASTPTLPVTTSPSEESATAGVNAITLSTPKTTSPIEHSAGQLLDAGAAVVAPASVSTASPTATSDAAATTAPASPAAGSASTTSSTPSATGATAGADRGTATATAATALSSMVATAGSPEVSTLEVDTAANSQPLLDRVAGRHANATGAVSAGPVTVTAAAASGVGAATATATVTADAVRPVGQHRAPDNDSSSATPHGPAKVIADSSDPRPSSVLTATGLPDGSATAATSTASAATTAGSDGTTASMSTAIAPGAFIPTVAAPAAATPAGPTAPPVPTAPVFQQVAGNLIRLSAAGDGTHRMTIALHPLDLGPVHVEVRLKDGAMSVALASDLDATRDTLRSALPDLHRELAGSGLSDVTLSLDSSGPQSFDQSARHRAFDPQPVRETAGDHRGATLAESVSAATATRARPSVSDGVDRWL